MSLVIGGVNVSAYIAEYSCESTPIFSKNEIPSYKGEKKKRKLGDTVRISARLEDVSDEIASELAAALNGGDNGKVEAEYTSPIQCSGNFYTISYKAECEEGDPLNIWIITFTLESSDTADSGDGL